MRLETTEEVKIPTRRYDGWGTHGNPSEEAWPLANPRYRIRSMDHPRIALEIIVGCFSIYCGFWPRWSLSEKGRLPGRLIFALAGVLLLGHAFWQIVRRG